MHQLLCSWWAPPGPYGPRGPLARRASSINDNFIFSNSSGVTIYRIIVITIISIKFNTISSDKLIITISSNLIITTGN